MVCLQGGPEIKRECVCVVCVRDGNFVKGFLYFVKDFIILSVLFENFAS